MTFTEMAQSIRASRQEFSEIYTQAQIEQGLNDRERFEAIALKGVDVADFETALTHAQAGGWLQLLLRLLIQRDRHDGDLIRALAELMPGNADLQAMVNPAAGFPQPAFDMKGVAGAMQWTVGVLIDNQRRGTGILVGPHLVLTAWHVVQPLFSLGPNGESVPREDGGARLAVEFDNRLAAVGPAVGGVPVTPLRIGAHAKWCVAFSPCHPDELVAQLPANLAQLDGKWDYAVIRLAATPGLERRWVSLTDDAVVPIAKSQIFLFQHPAAQPLVYGRGDILASPGGNADSIVPRVRFLHGVNALGGSSGGPCFDKTFTLFGIHQGSWPSQGQNGAVLNRGIPILRVRESIRLSMPELPAPDPSDSPVWRLAAVNGDPERPIIGCDVIQTLAWKAAMNASPRVLLITGDSQSGKSFRLDVLASLLHEAGHLKIPIVSQMQLTKSAAQFAEDLCKLAGATLPPFESPAEMVSTEPEWVKNELTRRVVEGLAAVRDGRRVWLLFRDLNKATVLGDGTSDFLFALYDQAASVDWLRIVLDGPARDVSFKVSQLTERDRTSPPGAQDIEIYLRRALSAQNRVPVPETVQVLAAAGATAFAGFLNTPATALAQLANFTSQLRVILENKG